MLVDPIDEVNNRLLLWDLKKDPDHRYRLVEARNKELGRKQGSQGMWADVFLGKTKGMW